MCFNKKAVLLSSKTKNTIDTLSSVCEDNNFVLYIVYKLSDLIEIINKFQFEILIIDTRYFSINDDLLSLFQKQNHYVPNIILLHNGRKTFSSKNVICFNIDDKIKICSCIEQCSKNSTYNKSSPDYVVFRNEIKKNLISFGFNSKYKGFNYMLDLLCNIINKNSFNISFKKHIYPDLANLYSVTEESVERDIRNILKIHYDKTKLFERLNFQKEFYKPSTRNLINCLAEYLTENLI